MRRKLLGLLVVVVVLSAVVVAIWAFGQSKRHPMTDAGSISATIVNVSPLVPGQVVEVAVHNNQRVAAGDVLFRVDPAPYQLRLDADEARLAMARSELDQGYGNVALQQSNASVSSDQITRAQNNLAMARATLARLEPLLAKNYVTAQEVDQARTAVQDAEVTLQQAYKSANGTQAFVGDTRTQAAAVQAALAAVALAKRDLNNSTVRAPVAGLVTGLTLAKGDYVVTATTLFSLIDTSQWRVSALFKETDLPQIHIGDRARVFLLSDPDLPIEGTVESIGWGVRAQDEAQILGLPLVASSLDWVRSAARFPVEIVLIDPPATLTRIGATAAVRILGQKE